MSTSAFNHEASSFIVHKEDLISFILLWHFSVGDSHHSFPCVGFYSSLTCPFLTHLSLIPKQKST